MQVPTESPQTVALEQRTLVTELRIHTEQVIGQRILTAETQTHAGLEDLTEANIQETGRRILTAETQTHADLEDLTEADIQETKICTPPKP